MHLHMSGKRGGGCLKQTSDDAARATKQEAAGYHMRSTEFPEDCKYKLWVNRLMQFKCTIEI